MVRVVFPGGMKLKAITFDVGETLMTPCPSVGSVYSEVAAGVGLGRVDPHDLEQSFRHAWKGRQRFAHKIGRAHV